MTCSSSLPSNILHEDGSTGIHDKKRMQPNPNQMAEIKVS
eukprot:CAMPEP_0197069446 /NCGR_PEP_ID=MMETSP1384-20130603/193215_1 /TAXON_ID=29189 /ORGANISM="Ammonia sp." /LENGTH=39 /DNA_ID= /DNA_START= /DNA_END= /DNA_ORIENTATION=